MEEVGPEEFKLEGVESPVGHESNLRKVEGKSDPWLLVDESVVDGDEGHETHVPQEVLGRHHFVESNECPGLDDHC